MLGQGVRAVSRPGVASTGRWLCSSKVLSAGGGQSGTQSFSASRRQPRGVSQQHPHGSTGADSCLGWGHREACPPQVSGTGGQAPCGTCVCASVRSAVIRGSRTSKPLAPGAALRAVWWLSGYEDLCPYLQISMEELSCVSCQQRLSQTAAGAPGVIRSPRRR